MLYLPPRRGERELKIDMIEQAFHILRPHGTLVVWSSYETDPFFRTLLKKIFGRVHARIWTTKRSSGVSAEGDRPRRRHEVTFQARVNGGAACRFLSRPGTFSYGRFDNGARALAEAMSMQPGDVVLDIGCGCGTNGVFAAQQAGPEGQITFVDSNVRAVPAPTQRTRATAWPTFEPWPPSRVEGFPENSFDVALANPPYFANYSIARLFLMRSRQLLKPDGRFYMVTKQVQESADLMMETFSNVEACDARGYTILSNTPIQE